MHFRKFHKYNYINISTFKITANIAITLRSLVINIGN